MSVTAWIVKSDGRALKVTYVSGWPWVREDQGGSRMLTNGCSGDRYGYLVLEPTDQVILPRQGADFTPNGAIIGEVTIGRVVQA